MRKLTQEKIDKCWEHLQEFIDERHIKEINDTLTWRIDCLIFDIISTEHFWLFPESEQIRMKKHLTAMCRDYLGLDNLERDPFEIDQVQIRMVKERTYYSDDILNTPAKVIKLLADELNEYDREVMAVINLDNSCKPININIASIGSIDRTIACPREMLKTSILSNASGMIICHNHPSGDPEPSMNDNIITDRMHQLCDLMGIQFMDHVIIGSEGRYFSYAEENYQYETKNHYTVDVGSYRSKHNILSDKEVEAAMKVAEKPKLSL